MRSEAGKAMLRILADGVAILQGASGQAPLSWTFQWYIHATPDAKDADLAAIFGGVHDGNRGLASEIWYTCQSHLEDTEPYFLPWHRLYVLCFEEIIRHVTGTPGFTMPYWNYTDPGSAAVPAEFRAENDPAFGPLFRANRNRDDGAQFADVNAGTPINKYFSGADNVLNLADMRPAHYGAATGFNAQLNQNLHGTLHRLVGDGTNMGRVPTAAGDPLFWVHHSNIDRIWCGWNAAGGRNPTDPGWLGKTFVFAGGDGRRVEVPVGTIADSSALSYRYDALPAPPGNLPRARRAAPNLVARSGGGAPVPVMLSALPQTIVLSPVSGRAGGRLILRLNNIHAPVDPGTLYRIYIGAGRFVGLLNFFDDVAIHQRAGRTATFDVTDLVEPAQGEIAVTLEPAGSLNLNALPAIMGGVDLTRE